MSLSSLPDFAPSWQATLHWQPTPDQQRLFQHLFEGILQGNQQMNLTRITEPTEFLEKHLWDALSGLAPWISPDMQPDWLPAKSPLRAIDIGTGAGIPGLPAAIACPDWQVTLLDSTKKKVRFLAELAEAMGLKQVQAIADRAEFLAHQPSHRELYDVAMLRAVGPAATCAEYALPLLQLNGIAILYRGQWSDEESQQLAPVVAQLGGQVVGIQAWQTPVTRGIRHCVYVQKQHPTSDEFPRTVGLPAKTPLVG